MENLAVSPSEMQGLYLSLKIGLFGFIIGFVCGCAFMREYLLTKFDLKRK